MAAVALEVCCDRHNADIGFLIFQKASTTGVAVKIVLEVGVIV